MWNNNEVVAAVPGHVYSPVRLHGGEDHGHRERDAAEGCAARIGLALRTDTNCAHEDTNAALRTGAFFNGQRDVKRHSLRCSERLVVILGLGEHVLSKRHLTWVDRSSGVGDSCLRVSDTSYDLPKRFGYELL